MYNRKPLTLIIFFIFLVANIAFAQEVKVEIPDYNDKYSEYVTRLENGDVNIDYTDFRNSFLDSKQFRKKRASKYDSLKSMAYHEIKNKAYQQIIKITKAMLSIDYTSMFAHKYLQQTYKILGDTVNQKKYHDIEFGLLNSIVNSGDGKTCETGWYVTQIEEEYFTLNVIDAQFQTQAITYDGKNTCDKMSVKTDDGERTYYFEANKIFESEKKLLGF